MLFRSPPSSRISFRFSRSRAALRSTDSRTDGLAISSAQARMLISMARRLIQKEEEGQLCLVLSGHYHYHKCAMSVPCIQTTSIFSEKSSNKEIKEDNLLSHRAPLEDKPISSRVRHRGFKVWTMNIANALINLCCCLPRRKKPRLGQNSISPEK